MTPRGQQWFAGHIVAAGWLMLLGCQPSGSTAPTHPVELPPAGHREHSAPQEPAPADGPNTRTPIEVHVAVVFTPTTEAMKTRIDAMADDAEPPAYTFELEIQSQGNTRRFELGSCEGWDSPDVEVANIDEGDDRFQIAQSFCSSGEDIFANTIEFALVDTQRPLAPVLWRGSGTFRSDFGLCQTLESVPWARREGDVLVVTQETGVVFEPSPEEDEERNEMIRGQCPVSPKVTEVVVRIPVRDDE